MALADTINDCIRTVLCVPVETLTSETRLADTHLADSLDIVEIVIELEVRLDIDIEDEDAAKCETVGQVHELVNRLVAEQT